VPGPADNALFSAILGAYSISFSAGATNNMLDVDGDTVTMNLNNFAYNVTGAGASGVHVGSWAGSTGQLRISNGSLAAVTSYLGQDPTAVGIATIDAGGKWTNSSSIIVGLSGTGTLTVNSGGTLTSNNQSTLGLQPGSNGFVNVTGSGAQWTGTQGVF